MNDLKTLKVPKAVHKELKVFVANNPQENMIDVTGYAVMEYLKNKGHKFTVKQNKKAISNGQ